MKKTIVIFSQYIDNKYFYNSYIHAHARGYVKEGYNVIVLALYPVLPILNFFKKNRGYSIDEVNVLVYKRFSVSGLFSKSRFNINGYLYYLSSKRIVKKIMKCCDVVLFDAHTIRCQGYTVKRLKKRYPNISTVLTTHGGDLDIELSHKNGIKTVLNISSGVDRIVAVSDVYANKLRNIGVKNVNVIYNGIEMYKNNEKVKKETSIATVALLSNRRKNIDMLIKAFVPFSKNNPNYRLKIIGDGPLREELEKLTIDLEIDNKVDFLGELSNENVFKELAKSYCFILPSILEGFGIVYPEAMYCGCVTIGTKGEGIDGFIKNGKNGFLIDPNEESIIKILEYVVRNDCSKIIKQGIIDSKKLTWERNCKEYLKSVLEE